MKHELVQLAGKNDWAWLDDEIVRRVLQSRFVIGLMLLKHIYGLSDEGVCEHWVYDPYFQFFTGEEFFQHEFRHERSDLSHGGSGSAISLSCCWPRACGWRTRSARCERRPSAGHGRYHGAAQGHHVPHRRQALARGRQGAQPPSQKTRRAASAILSACRQVRGDDGGSLCSREAFNRHRRQLRILRSRLGRIIRDIGRKIAGQPALQEVFASAPRPRLVLAWLRALLRLILTALLGAPITHPPLKSAC
jgi:IS5 family transposase